MTPEWCGSGMFEGVIPLHDPSRIDPDRVRLCVLEALHELPGGTELEALHAVDRGELHIELGSFKEELIVHIGDLTITIDRSSCVIDE